MKNSISEKFRDANIAETCEIYDKIAGANKNIGRIASNVIDGLKPVHKRLIYIMSLKYNGLQYRKLASITGEVFGNLHPHATTSIDDAAVLLAQPWNNSIPLIDGGGNWGSISGDAAAAPRYIECRLTEYAYDCFIKDFKESVVNMKMGYTNELEEPKYLPAKYPNVLLNGTLGIGYGMATNIPPFNFREIVDASVKLLKNPDANVMLIPDSPTGADIIATDFQKISDTGNGSYRMRCKYEIDSENNIIRITSIPYHAMLNKIIEKIADIKEKNGLPELTTYHDMSGKVIDLRLYIRDDVNPYKFMKKLIKCIPGLEMSYPVMITAISEYKAKDYSIRGILLEWLKYRREQKRVIVCHKHSSLLAEQRTNDIKVFIMSKDNLDRTIEIFRTNKNRQAIEAKLLETYRDSPIAMDSLQARALADMRFLELSTESYDKYVARQKELVTEIGEIVSTLESSDGIDNLIIEELQEGAKKHGTPRRSNIIPYKISVDTDIEGSCILQLSSDGMLFRKECSNIDEAVPSDMGGYAVKVENDCSFIAVDEFGMTSFIKVKEIPIDQEVPLNRFINQKLGNIIALLPYDIESDKCCTLISAKGQMKRMAISEISPSKRACIKMDKDDRLVKGIITSINSSMDILIFTQNGKGQRFDPNSIKLTSFSAKGGEGFKIDNGDSIIGAYTILPERNQYLLYVTSRGKVRLNRTEFLPMRNSKYDSMVNLITLSDRDKLVAICGCNKCDKVQVYFDDQTSEIIDVSSLKESTMSAEAKKVTEKSSVSNRILKVKLV